MDALDISEIFKKAKAYALRLLKFRPRSEKEIFSKLILKDYPADIATRVIAELQLSGYVDDLLFARIWAQSRLKKYGYQRVLRELIAKGIAKDILNDLFDQLKEDFDEEAIARVILERRLRFYQGLPLMKRKRRLMDYLLRRGFSSETINKVTKEL